MLTVLRRWHWTLLHRVFGLPDRNHTEPQAPLSVVLRSHPEVLAHRRRHVGGNSPSFQAQLNREAQRQPRILKSWQRRIGGLVNHQIASQRARSGQRSEP